MTRHGKNSTASAVYSYSERKKDSKQSGYGTLTERLGADSVKPFDCCCLTLQPCKNPMITPDGYVFEKEAILEYIVNQKKEFKRRNDAYEKYMMMEEDRKKTVDQESEEEKKRRFVAMESTPTHVFAYGGGNKRKATEDAGPSTKKDKYHEGSLSNMADEKAKEWRSFWVPELQSTAEGGKMEKPPQKVTNPVNGKPLKFKDLMPVIFTPVDEEAAKTNLIYSMKDRYKCPVTGDILTNSSRCAYIKPSQKIVSWNCVEKIIKKDMIDPLTNKKLAESDIVELQRGGTGFSSTNKIEAKLARPQMELA
ncbi:unnamed protein product [Bursaphelenchus okinawaensis]|uniref:Nitric oxide synthase-interacting protein homolog n=1 Tax=Bursaphelenchus okinawaensis TaxID=465554 RepID=A0A811LM14_9BILA|nr:unnamed protein product [Bursaphelenchus okinawaensis]CAG9126844.1 unnamed protein product [Bursaphelenchus okinawaensis]